MFKNHFPVSADGCGETHINQTNGLFYHSGTCRENLVAVGIALHPFSVRVNWRIENHAGEKPPYFQTSPP